jgi:hypothetical protein
MLGLAVGSLGPVIPTYRAHSYLSRQLLCFELVLKTKEVILVTSLAFEL